MEVGELSIFTQSHMASVVELGPYLGLGAEQVLFPCLS